jgi:hypothetical protein
VSRLRPAYYAPTGTRAGDLIAVLHPPYTAWHLAYVAIGASLGPALDWLRLGGTALAFFLGTGIATHALDELHDRPLRTGLSNRALLVLVVGGYAGAVGVAVAGVVVISPWVLAWAALGIALASGYALSIHPWLHSELGFALAWGAFPVLAGHWAQAEGFSLPVLAVAAAATILSLVQHGLSSPARFVRRTTQAASASFKLEDGTDRWSRERLLATWERPLRLLGWAVVLLGAGLLALRAAG